MHRDQRLYEQRVGEGVQAPRPLTPENKGRYADGVLDLRRKRIITIFEDHSRADSEAVNSIAAVGEPACQQARCQCFVALLIVR